MNSSLKFLILVFALLVNIGVKAQESQLDRILKAANPSVAQGSEAISFESKAVSLGVISEDATNVKGSFKFSNQCDKPLVIVKVVVTCSCVKVDFERRPIVVGGSGEIKFHYSPKGYPGSINRRLMVYTNLSESSPTAILTISGDVTPSNDHSLNFPYAMGDLRLRQKQVSFRDAEQQSVERILVINDGERPLHLGVLGALPAGLSFSTEPAVIAPGAEADLVVKFDPKVWRGESMSYPLVIDGLNVSPLQRTISVNFQYLNKK